MEAQPVAGARTAQARTKKNKTSKPKHTADQALRSGQSEALMEATDVEVEEFEDDGNAWKSGQSPVTYLSDKTAYSSHSPLASQVIRAVEQVKKPDHWPQEFAKSVKERQRSLLEEVHVKSQVL
jgi:hypothetical protein